MKRLLPHAALVLQTLFGAGTFLAAKFALQALGPTELVLLRASGAALCFAPLLALAPKPSRAQLPRLALLGLLGVVLNQGLLFAGLSFTSASHAALIFALTPLFVFALGLALRTERARPMKLLGLLLALVGAAVVVLERAPGQAQGALVGDLILLVAALAWAGYTVLARPLVQALGTVAVTGWGFLFGALLFLPFGLPHASGLVLSEVPASAWWTLAFLVLGGSMAMYLLWGYALRTLEPSRVAVYTNLQPVATALLAWWVLGEPVTAGLAAGGLLVVLGVAATTRGRGGEAPKDRASAAVVPGGGAG